MLNHENLEKHYKKNCKSLQLISDEFRTHLRDLLNAHNVKFHIKHRIKSFEGYFEKLQAQEQGSSRKITDIIGLRVICPFLDDLSEVESVICSSLPVLEVDHKGQKSGSEFGYASVHFLIDLSEEMQGVDLEGVEPVCELQLRTILQDAWAEVEHSLIYKFDWNMPTDLVKRKLAALNANLTLSDIMFQELRDFQREVARRQNIRRNIQDQKTGLLQKEKLHTVLGPTPTNPETAETRKENLEKTLLQALNLHSDGDFSGAIPLYGKAIALCDLRDVRSILFNHRGMAYFALGEMHASLDDFRQSVRYDENNYRAWANFGHTWRNLGNGTEALEAFRRSMEIKPDYWDPFLASIRLLWEFGQFSRAHEIWDHIPLKVRQSDKNMQELANDLELPVE